jgi:lysozyme
VIEGIDVSSWQGVIDWSKVKSTPVKFAYIKATEGATYTNPNFHRDWSQSREHGIIRGAYHFLAPTSEAEDQLANFAAVVRDLQAGDLPPALDIEGEKWGPLPAKRKWQLFSHWLAEAERAFGVPPAIYIGFYFANDVLQTRGRNELLRYPLWVPNYHKIAQPLIPEPWQTYTFWQYTNQGTVDGVDGNVDRNRFEGGLEDLIKLCCN